MADEQLLPTGEPGIEVTALPILKSDTSAAKPAAPAPEVVVPAVLPGVPSPKAQSWGTLISIIIIVLMIIVGAFYAWGKRIAQENALSTPPSAQQ